MFNKVRTLSFSWLSEDKLNGQIFSKKQNLFDSLSQWVGDKRRTGQVKVGGHDFLIPRQVFRSFPLTESVTRLTSAPLPKQEKREVGLYPEGALMIIFLFCFVWVDGPLTVQLKSSITNHKTTKLDFFMIIYPVIFSMPDISVAEHVHEFNYPAHWLLFQF